MFYLKRRTRQQAAKKVAWKTDHSIAGPKWIIPHPHHLYTHIYIYWLVVLTILKNMKVNGKDYPIYDMENKIFQTTNQYIYIYHVISIRILCLFHSCSTIKGTSQHWVQHLKMANNYVGKTMPFAPSPSHHWSPQIDGMSHSQMGGLSHCFNYPH